MKLRRLQNLDYHGQCVTLLVVSGTQLRELFAQLGTNGYNLISRKFIAFCLQLQWYTHLGESAPEQLFPPGYREISDWPTGPKFPLTISSHGAYRDPNPHPSYYIDFVDADGTKFPFFFDRFLGRLCYGSNLETGDDAAFVSSDSILAKAVFTLILSAIEGGIDDADDLQVVLNRARHWA